MVACNGEMRRRTTLSVRYVIVISALIAVVYWFTRSTGGGSKDTAGRRGASPSQARAVAFRRLQSLPDTRSAECKAEADEVSAADQSKVSAVVFARLDKDSIATQTVASLIAHTAPARLHEIIIITAAGVSEERVNALNYDLGAYGDIVKVATSETLPADNSLRSRILVAHLAKAPLVALLEDSVVVHRGWLQPLAAELERDPNAVAVPVFDSFDPATLDFQKTMAVHTWHFDWDFSLAAVQVRPDGAGEGADARAIAMPALTGHALLVRKSFLDNTILERRPEADFDGPLDLSILSWLCGGGIYVVPCSRAARVGALRSLEPPPAKESLTLAARYLDKEHYSVYAKVRGGGAQRDTLARAAEWLQNCKSFPWYMSVPASEVYVPEDNVRAYGWLVSYSGLMCFWHETDGRVSGSHGCQGARDEAAMVKLLTDGTLNAGGDRCLGVDRDKYAIVTACNASDDQQLWTLTGGMQLQLTRQRSHCLMHATDPNDAEHARQVLMVAPCSRAGSDESKWQRWTKFKVLSE